MTGNFSLLIALHRVRHPVLVVGGGKVGERKVATLTGAGCEVHLVAPDATESLVLQASAGALRWTRRMAACDDFLAHRFAVLALPPHATRLLLDEARRAGCLVNCVSLPDESDWAFCAQFTCGDLRVGVGSGGTSPAESAAMKRRLASYLSANEEKKP